MPTEPPSNEASSPTSAIDAEPNRDEVKKLGLVGVVYLMISSLAGSGIIALPQQLAFTGSITLVSFILVTIGAFCLAMVYVKASASFDDPSPVSLASTISPIVGAKCGFFYVYGNLISNVAILIAGLGYLAIFVPALNEPMVLGVAVIALIWIFVGLSLRGIGLIAQVASLAVSLLLLAVLLTSILGWLDFSPAQFQQNWNVSGKSTGSALMAGFAVLLFAYVGVESVATNVGHISNPKQTIPLATIIGFAVVAVLYLLSTTVMEGMFAAKTIQNTPASFGLAMAKIFHSTVVGDLVAIIMSVACLASFIVWGLNAVSAAKTSADKGFLPSLYSHTNSRGIASRGLIVNGIIMTLVELVLMVLGSDIAEAFQFTVTISVLLLLFPYFWSGIALIKKAVQDGTHSLWTNLYVTLSSLFLIAAFVSADFDELMVVIILNMIVPGIYAVLINVRFITVK